MTTDQLPRTIQATIHQDALTRVPDFFNASVADILNEMLQNARRSGATQVDIITHADKVTIADNGAGIRDPQSLLSFGKSDWDQRTQQSENPAGMGIYSLARRDEVLIRSRVKDGQTWAVTLNRDHFTGGVPAHVDLLHSMRPSHGTSVTFRVEHPADLHHRVKAAAQHYPLPVTFDGEPVPQQDFLHSAHYVETWRGIRIGVAQHYFNSMINFHGVTVRYQHLEPVNSMLQRWHPHMDVMDCPELRLTLPARREVVETPFLQELNAACQRAIYRAIAASPDPIDMPRYEQLRAAELGVTIPDARPRLKQWKPATSDHYRRDHRSYQDLPEHPVLVDADLDTAHQQSLGHAIQDHEISPRLCQRNSWLEGYDWYEKIPKLSQAAFSATINGEEQDLHALFENGHAPQGDVKADRLTVKISITSPQGETAELSLPTDLYVHDSEDPFLDQAEFLVTQDARLSPGELAEILHDVYFSPADEHESDTYETQETHHRKETLRAAHQSLYTQEEALRQNLMEAAHNHLRNQLPAGTTAVITLNRENPGIKVELRQQPQPPEDPRPE